MSEQTPDVIRHREILFRAPHPDPRQAHSATLILTDVEGVVKVEPQGDLHLYVSYDITFISLQVIEEVLIEFGYHLDNNLLNKLKRALYHYSEEVTQSQLGCRAKSGCTQAVFIHKYRQRPHGCRDERPEHWRHYL